MEFITGLEQQGVPSPRAVLRLPSHPLLSAFLVGHEDDLGQQTEFEEQVYDDSNLYLSPTQAWIEGACEKKLSRWQGFETLKAIRLETFPIVPAPFQ